MYRTNSGVAIEIRGNVDESEYYAKYVKPFFRITTGVEPVSTIRAYAGARVVGIRCCRREAYSILHQTFGFPIGEKSLRVKVPSCILRLRNLWEDYIRGVFDTDGSVYMRKQGKRKSARSLVLDISSSSRVHIFQLYGMVRTLGFNCWLEGTHVRMAGWSTVNEFFQRIRPRNPTHIKRLSRFNALGRGRLAW